MSPWNRDDDDPLARARCRRRGRRLENCAPCCSSTQTWFSIGGGAASSPLPQPHQRRKMPVVVASADRAVLLVERELIDELAVDAARARVAALAGHRDVERVDVELVRVVLEPPVPPPVMRRLGEHDRVLRRVERRPVRDDVVGVRTAWSAEQVERDDRRDAARVAVGRAVERLARRSPRGCSSSNWPFGVAHDRSAGSRSVERERADPLRGDGLGVVLVVAGRLVDLRTSPTVIAGSIMRVASTRGPTSRPCARSGTSPRRTPRGPALGALRCS